jgi:hypothetical protein
MRKATSATAPSGRRTRTIRSTAALLGLLLVFGSLAPPLALAKRESDTEGEGTSSPGALPGLEIGIGHEPSGEETTLTEVPVGPEESEAEEEVTAPEIETTESGSGEQVMAPAAEGAPPPEAEVAVPVEVTPTPTTEPAVPPPPIEPPAYGVEPAPPAYEPSPSSAAPSGEAVVENEPIAAPMLEPASPGEKAAGRAPEVAPESVPTPVVPVVPTPAPSSPAAAVIPVAAPEPAGSLAGKRTHQVAAGECLWDIAAAYLSSGASNAEIAAEVHRLWRMNAMRIGTGDPDLVMVGTTLRLR